MILNILYIYHLFSKLILIDVELQGIIVLLRGNGMQRRLPHPPRKRRQRPGIPIPGGLLQVGRSKGVQVLKEDRAALNTDRGLGRNAQEKEKPQRDPPSRGPLPRSVMSSFHLRRLQYRRFPLISLMEKSKT